MAAEQNRQSPKQHTTRAYISEVVREVLKRTDGPNAAPIHKAPNVPMSRDRIFLELMAGDVLQFAALPTKPGWEENLIPIRIPLRRGLQGYRLFLIHERDQKALRAVETLEELTTFETGSGDQWSTNAAMIEAGFSVQVAPSKQNILDMMKADRFDTFARGVDEIYFDHAQWADDFPTLSIEESLAIFIPAPTYFFVTPKRPDLADRLERGLRSMVSDGTLKRLFWKHYSDELAAARLHERKIFRLSNPNLSPETPLDDRSLWFEPEEYLHFSPVTE